MTGDAQGREKAGSGRGGPLRTPRQNTGFAAQSNLGGIDKQGGSARPRAAQVSTESTVSSDEAAAQHRTTRLCTGTGPVTMSR